MRGFSILLVAIVLSFFPATADNSEILWSQKTDWGEVRVRQEGRTRILMFADEEGETEESRLLLDRPLELQAPYLRQMLEAASYVNPRKEGRKLLVVGMGAGSLSRALSERDPRVTVTSVEIEPAVVEAARRFFFYKDSDRLITVVDDARHFLEMSHNKYDAIFLDAFDGVDVPEPLRTVEFARLLDGHLEPGGAVLANIHFVPEEPSLRYQKSLSEVFAHRYMARGVAQGVGVYSHQEILTSSGPNPSQAPGSVDAAILLQPALLPPLHNVQPYRDGQP